MSWIALKTAGSTGAFSAAIHRLTSAPVSARSSQNASLSLNVPDTSRPVLHGTAADDDSDHQQVADWNGSGSRLRTCSTELSGSSTQIPAMCLGTGMRSTLKITQARAQSSNIGSHVTAHRLSWSGSRLC